MDKAELDEYLAGLAIDDQGHIVAVDLVSPTVFRITENGELVKLRLGTDRIRTEFSESEIFRQFFGRLRSFPNLLSNRSEPNRRYFGKDESDPLTPIIN